MAEEFNPFEKPLDPQAGQPAPPPQANFDPQTGQSLQQAGQTVAGAAEQVQQAAQQANFDPQTGQPLQQAAAQVNQTQQAFGQQTGQPQQAFGQPMGQPQQAFGQQVNPQQMGQKGNAKTIRILGIVSIIAAFFIPLVGVICGALGMARANRETKTYGDADGSLSKAKILCLIGLIIAIIMWIVGAVTASSALVNSRLLQDAINTSQIASWM